MGADILVGACLGLETGQSQAPSCQTHFLGNALIPQKLRSLRKVRARAASPDLLSSPSKRPCYSKEAADSNDAAIAELLLGLSNSPASSPRESEVSTEDEEFLVVSPRKRRRAANGKGSPLSRGGRKAFKIVHASSEDASTDDCDLESTGTHTVPGKASRKVAAKKVPGRCKCGKRVSASHPPCKSELMLLCERFRDSFGHLSTTGEPSRIHLNECAVTLGVPRRRLYDITIVYEAVEIIKRTGKLAYVWRGMAHLPLLVEQLKREEEVGQPVGDRKGSSQAPQPADQQTTHSLWTLSRKFIRLLLTAKGPVQLTDAAQHLIGKQVKEVKRHQTQVTVERRLYDIGSILATMNLIHRIYINGKRQPAFSWNWDWKMEQPITSQALQQPAQPDMRPAAVLLPVPERTAQGILLEPRKLPVQSHTPVPDMSGGLNFLPPSSVDDFCPASVATGSEHSRLGAGSLSMVQMWSLSAPISMPLPCQSLDLSRMQSIMLRSNFPAQQLSTPQSLPPFSALVLPMSYAEQHCAPISSSRGMLPLPDFFQGLQQQA